MTPRVVPTESAAETRALGEALGRLVQSGDLLCLMGDLGAGKTTFTQGLALGLDLPSDHHVPSPTFTLLAEHPAGRIPLYHFDVYRLNDGSGLYDLAFDEYLEGEGVVVMEWADRVLEALPLERLEIHIEQGEAAERREITLTGFGARGVQLLRQLEEVTS